MRRLSRYWICFTAACKIMLAYFCVVLFHRRYLSENIWLILEKATEARDNAYHLFKYIREQHPEIHAYYVITKDSPDKHKVDAYGNVILFNSFRHYVYYAAARYSIGSQPYGAAPFPQRWLSGICVLKNRKQKEIFLQHGIIKDDLPVIYCGNAWMDLFVTSCEREYEFVKKNFGYPEGTVQLLGLCRFDNLYRHQDDTPEKIILVMPTFRKYLAAEDSTRPATEEEARRFRQSSFYLHYAELLSDPSLLAEMAAKGYKIVFYLHYALQSYCECFRGLENDQVVIADRHSFDVQQLLLGSSVLVTDFSSVFFDFAYMKKPEVFFQFDEEEYRSQHYAKGYFDYREDAFGPVLADTASVVRYLMRMLQSGCKMESTYLDRVNGFFTLRDAKNCERNFAAIRQL